MAGWPAWIVVAWIGLLAAGCSDAPAEAAEPTLDQVVAGPAPLQLDAPPPREELPVKTPAALPEPEPVTAAAPEPGPAAPRRDEEPDTGERSPALQKAIERAIANGITTANQRSKGKVHGNNCVVAVHVVELDSGAERASRMADSVTYCGKPCWMSVAPR